MSDMSPITMSTDRSQNPYNHDKKKPVGTFAKLAQSQTALSENVFNNNTITASRSNNGFRATVDKSLSSNLFNYHEYGKNQLGNWLDEGFRTRFRRNPDGKGLYFKPHKRLPLLRSPRSSPRSPKPLQIPHSPRMEGDGAKKLTPRVLLYERHCPVKTTLLSPRSPRNAKNRIKSPSNNSVTSKNKETTPPLIASDGDIEGGEKTASSEIADDYDETDSDSQSDVFDNDDELDKVSNSDDDGALTDTSSNSEDGYWANAYKLHLLKKASLTTVNSIPKVDCDTKTSSGALLAPSLFPNVPPYLAFCVDATEKPYVPPELYRILKWRVTKVMPKVVRNVLSNSGVRLLKKTNDWMGIWGRHMKSPCFKAIRSYQKINHLPGSFRIGRKDSCWKCLHKQMTRHGKNEFGFMPRTYIIPHDLSTLSRKFPSYMKRHVKWILKPPASARGTGIRVVERWDQIPKRRPLIVQKYIERPLLINGSKFDIRLYVLVTSINPLRVFMYHDGLARFASVKYSNRSETLHDRCMHLTNYSINKFSLNYSKNEDVNACHGHKWTLRALLSYLSRRGVRINLLWEALQSLVCRTVLSGEQQINNMIKYNMESKYSCFELFGFDILLDSELVPWLLEVNISPSLHSDLPLDAHVKAPLVQGVLNTALYHIPPKLSIEKQMEICAKLSLPLRPICFDKRIYIKYLSKEEKEKHLVFTKKTMEDRDEYITAILENLTPDDIRCLIVAEDELARCSPLQRIFPTNGTHKYLKYTEVPRYYNRLLDAWESRYGEDREKGIALLQEYCGVKYHLVVPEAPAKKDFFIKFVRWISKS